MCPSLSPVLSHHTCLLLWQGLWQNVPGSPCLPALTSRCILQWLPPQHRHCSGPRAQLCLTLCNPMGCSPQAPLSMEFSQQKNTRVGSRALFQGVFLTQGLNPQVPCFLYCRETFLPTEPLGNASHFYPTRLILNSVVEPHWRNSQKEGGGGREGWMNPPTVRHL